MKKADDKQSRNRENAVPIDHWIPEDPHDFSDWMGTFGPLPKVDKAHGDADRGLPEPRRRGRYVPATSRATEVTALGPKGAKANARTKKPQDSSG